MTKCNFITSSEIHAHFLLLVLLVLLDVVVVVAVVQVFPVQSLIHNEKSKWLRLSACMQTRVFLSHLSTWMA